MIQQRRDAMKKALVFIIVCFCFLMERSGAAAESSTLLHEQEREWFGRGQESIAFGKYDEAITCFEKVLALNPDFTDAYRFIGDVYMKKGMLDSAIQSYKKALDSKAQKVPALIGLGNSCFQKTMLDEALSAYDRALAIQPDNALAHIGQGDVYLKKEDIGSALSEYQKGLALEPDHAEAHLALGLIFQKKGENSVAAQHFYKAGLLFIKEGNRKNALTAYEHLKQTKTAKLEQLLYDALQSSIK